MTLKHVGGVLCFLVVGVAGGPVCEGTDGDTCGNAGHSLLQKKAHAGQVVANEVAPGSVCPSGYQLEAHMENTHGDVCRADYGSGWVPPTGCDKVDASPWSTETGKSTVCRKTAPVCTNVAGTVSTTYPCKCGHTTAATKECIDTQLCYASSDTNGVCTAGCGDGYIKHGDGHWENQDEQPEPFGCVLHQDEVPVAECKAKCDQLFGCIAFDLFVHSHFGSPATECCIYKNTGVFRTEETTVKEYSLACRSTEAPTLEPTEAPTLEPTEADTWLVGTPNSNSCPEGYTAITTESKCKQAANDLKKMAPPAFSSAAIPKGCVDMSGACSFNKHSTGGNNPTMSPVCEAITGKCEPWCEGNIKTWKKKCRGSRCRACPQCAEAPTLEPTEAPTLEPTEGATTTVASTTAAPPTAITGTCEPWCEGSRKTWKNKCQWSKCRACPQCAEANLNTMM